MSKLKVDSRAKRLIAANPILFGVHGLILSQKLVSKGNMILHLLEGKKYSSVLFKRKKDLHFKSNLTSVEQY